MPRTATANRQLRETARLKIIESALAVFASAGYGQSSMRAIATHAGVSNGLAYHYFDSKEALVGAVFDHCMGLLSQTIEDVYITFLPPNRLPALVDALLDQLVAERDFWALFYMLRAQPDVMAALGDEFREWTGRLRDLFITNLRAADRPDPIVDGYLLYSMLEGTIQQYLLDPKNYPLNKVKVAIKKIYEG